MNTSTKHPNKEIKEQNMKRSRKVKGLMETLIVIGLILIIPLFFAIKTRANPSTVPNTAMPVISTAANPPADSNALKPKQPPACTFPLAQTTTKESTPEAYSFSEPQVVLTSTANLDIVEWLPDNRRVLIMRDIPDNGQQSIEIFDSLSRDTQVYAIRTTTIDAPPSWASELNAVVYPAINITKKDKINHSYEFTRQAWASQGDPKNVQLLADDMKQFYVTVKPDGRQTSYLSDKQLSKRNESLASLPSLPFDLTKWASPDAAFQATWRPGASQIFLYNTSYVPSVPGYTFLLDVDSGKICNIELGNDTSGNAWAISAHWSPNGRYLATVRASGTLPLTYSDLAVLDTATGKLYMMDIISNAEKGLHFIKDIAWAPDSQHLTAIAGVYVGETRHSGLYLVDFISGQNIHLLPAYEFHAGWAGTNLVWSPDGSGLLVSCPNKEGEQLCLVNVQKSIKP